MSVAQVRRWGGAAVAVMAAVGVGLTAAPASAIATSITVSDTNMYVGKTYTITVHCEQHSTVGVSIDVDAYSAEPGQILGGGPVAPDANLLATVQWTPDTPGAHTIEAYGCAAGAPPDYRPPTATLAVTVKPAPTAGTGTGSASSIPIIGGLLSSLLH
ncbi:hypothetical protein [Nocardia tengchongensis]|uniref:hypothetical protein n=1 Tax=Nocardia tengchongensis TaxID=2055889 RepID=UPI0036A0BD21